MYSEYAKLRDERGLTDYRVSKDTGIPTATLSDWKQGVYTPKVDKMLKLAEYFGVPVETLIRKEDQ